MSDTDVLICIVIFLSAVALLNSMGLPAQYQIITNYGLAGIGGSALAVAAACVVTTGALCAGVLIVTNVALTAFLLVSAVPVISLLITGPINLIMSWLLFRLARGNA